MFFLVGGLVNPPEVKGSICTLSFGLALAFSLLIACISKSLALPILRSCLISEPRSLCAALNTFCWCCMLPTIRTCKVERCMATTAPKVIAVKITKLIINAEPRCEDTDVIACLKKFLLTYHALFNFGYH